MVAPKSSVPLYNTGTRVLPAVARKVTVTAPNVWEIDAPSEHAQFCQRGVTTSPRCSGPLRSTLSGCADDATADKNVAPKKATSLRAIGFMQCSMIPSDPHKTTSRNRLLAGPGLGIVAPQTNRER